MNLKKAFEVVNSVESMSEKAKADVCKILYALASPHDAIQEFHVGDRVKDKKGVFIKLGKVEGFDDRGWPKVQWCISACSVCPTPHNPADLEVLPPATPPPAKFQVDDFVRVKSYSEMELKGKSGKVVTFSENLIGVEFAERVLFGHNCYGPSADQHGRWFLPRDLELIDRPGGE